MKLGDVIHDPGSRGVASTAIKAHSLPMHVLVTINTGSFGLIEFQRGMALFAICSDMFSLQRKNFIVIE